MLPISARGGRLIRNRLPSREARESFLRLETEAFEKGVARFVSRVPKKAGVAVQKLALDLTRFVVKGTPMRTGRAAAGWLPFAYRRFGARYGVSGSGVAQGMREGSFRAQTRAARGKPFVEVTNAVPYITVIESGSRPHVIEPGPGRRALKFVGRGGEYVFRRKVRHPGTRAYRPLVRAMRRLRRFTERAFEGMLKA